MDNVISALRKNIDNSIESKQGDSFTYIIGNNGTGKSRILGRLAKIYDSDTTSKTKSVLCVTNATYDRFVVGDKHNKMIYLGARSVGNAIFHVATDRTIAKFILDGIVNKARFLKRLNETTSEIFYFEFQNGSKASRALEEFVDKRKLRNTSIKEIFSPTEIKWLSTQLNAKLKFSSLTKEQAEVVARFVALNANVKIYVFRNSAYIDFKDLSSGEQNRILLAAKILSKASDNCLILIDEPEISLHLHWQMDFHQSLKRMLTGIKNYHVVTATHSPIIISESAKDKDSERIIILEQIKNQDKNNDRENIVEFNQVSSKIISSFDELTLDYFDTATYNTRTVDIEIAEALIAVAQNASLAEKKVKELQELAEKKGASSFKKTINEAISLLNKHLADPNNHENFS